MNHYMSQGGSLTALILCVLIVGAKRPRIFLAVALGFSVAFLIAGVVLNPAYDHGVFLARALSFTSVSGAFLDSEDNLAPAGGWLFLCLKLFHFPSLAVACGNGIILAAFVIRVSLLSRFKIAAWDLLMASVVLICVPTVINLGVSANKDFIIAFALISLLGSLQEISDPCALWARAIALINALAAFGIIWQARNYFCYFLATSLVAAALFHHAAAHVKLMRRFILPAVLIGGIISAAVVIKVKWNGYRNPQVLETYTGRAMVVPIFYASAPDNLVQASGYATLALGLNILGPLAICWTNPKVSVLPILASAIETLLILWLGGTFLLLGRTSSRIYIFMVFYLILHLAVQTCFSPNFGSLFRLRLFENMTILCLGTFYSRRAYAGCPGLLSQPASLTATCSLPEKKLAAQ